MATVRRTELDFEGHFTQIPNAWLRDTNLSLRAIGLLAQLLSHRDGWSVTIQSLATINGCGRDAIRTAVQELEEHGYLRREQERDDGGEYGRATWFTTSPSAENPATVNPSTENPAHKKTKTVKKNKNQDLADDETRQAFERFWDMYPRKASKGAALRAFLKIEAEMWPTVFDGVERMVQDPNLPPKQFVQHPATWLNQMGWENEPFPPRNVSHETKPAADIPGRDDWKKWYHDQDDHVFCDHD